MAKELEAMEYLCSALGTDAEVYRREREALTHAIREHCYDGRDGFF